MDLDTVTQRLAAHRPGQRTWMHRWRRAAVAVVLRPGGPGEEEAELLLVRRAERQGDPWSGHMALPGGLEEEADGGDIQATAARETWEEVALEGLVCIGRLDEQRAAHPRTRRPMALCPVVFTAPRDAVAVPHEAEIVEALWVPLPELFAPDNRFRYRRGPGLLAMPWEARRVRGNVVWGLTLRVLESLRGVL